MKLDRNINPDGTGKYALLRMRALVDMRSNSAFEDSMPPEIVKAIKTLDDAGVIDWGVEESESEFFVMRLKDKYAGAALVSYATAAAQDDTEYAAEIMALSKRAGSNSPFCKKPD